MTDLFDTFLKEKQYLQGVTPRTIQSYREAWIAFNRYGAAELTEQGAKDFMIEMMKSKMKPGGANAFARAINSYFTWLHENKHTETHIKIPLQKLEKRVLKTYTVEEVECLLDYKPVLFGEKRLHTILCLMADTGVRVQEALTLKRSNVDLENLLITVYGKGRKERCIPISVAGRKVLYRWMKTHNHDLVFCSRNGEKIWYDNLRRELNQLLDKTGVEKSEGAFHAFRRFFAKQYSRRGGNLFYLQKMLGHNTLEMTRKYVEVDQDDLREVQRHNSPLEAIKSHR